MCCLIQFHQLLELVVEHQSVGLGEGTLVSVVGTILGVAERGVHSTDGFPESPAIHVHRQIDLDALGYDHRRPLKDVAGSANWNRSLAADSRRGNCLTVVAHMHLNLQRANSSVKGEKQRRRFVLRLIMKLVSTVSSERFSFLVFLIFSFLVPFLANFPCPTLDL